MRIVVNSIWDSVCTVLDIVVAGTESVFVTRRA